MTGHRVQEWDEAWTRAAITVPDARSDKYSRGVLGLMTGSERFPGAAVLGVEAALRTGLGMVRYRGARRAEELVLQRRPEAVTASGRVQAWLLGSGAAPAAEGGIRPEDADRWTAALAAALPTVLDAGAIPLLLSRSRAGAAERIVITPHHGELAALLERERASVAADSEAAALEAQGRFGVTVLLKGSRTVVAGPGDEGRTVLLRLPEATPWLASAGTGDVLAGILGALVAGNAAALAGDPALLPRLAGAAARLHALAAERASGGGPLVALEVAEALPAVIAALLADETS